MIKKLAALGLCLAMLCALAVGASAAAVCSLGFDSVSGLSRGADVDWLDCKLNVSSGYGVSEFDLTLLVDSSLIITAIEDRVPNDTFEKYIATDGHSAVIKFSAGYNYGSNSLFRVKLKVANDATDGGHSVQLVALNDGQGVKYYEGSQLRTYSSDEYALTAGTIGVVVPPTPVPTPTPYPIDYAIEEKVSELKWDKTLDAEKGLTVTSSASYSKFVGVTLDGDTLTRDVDYSVEEGSTVVTIKPSVLSRLSVNQIHRVVIQSDDGRAVTDFTVVETPAPNPTATPTPTGSGSGSNNSSNSSTGSSSSGTRRSPQTGGNTELWILLIVAFAAAAVALAGAARRASKH